MLYFWQTTLPDIEGEGLTHSSGGISHGKAGIYRRSAVFPSREGVP